MNNTTSPTPQEPPKALPTFALPSELRRMIYQHLLNRTPHKTMLLYFDSFPNNRYLDLHPAILRVSRRTYTDAVPLLYGANTFEIYLNGRPSRGDNDPPLDRCRRPANFLRPPQQQDYNPVLLLRSLHTLRHLELSFSYNSFWGSARRPYLTLTAELVLEIIDILGRGARPTDPVIFTKQQRTLKLTIYSDAEGRCLNDSPPGFTTKGKGGFPRLFWSHVQDLVFLLENLRATTKVTAFEVLRQSPLENGMGGQVTREAELDDLIVPPA